ncbi:MAG TPA: helix-turn-helix transcriptional regulator [Thermoanaerobaculia bacterium]
MREVDERELRQVLREAVRLTGRSHRDLEEQLEIGHGNIQKLLTGRARVTVRHLLAFAELLDVPAAEFLALAYPEQAAAARRHLPDLLAPGLEPNERRAASAALPASREELAEIVRAAVRAELDQRAPAPSRGARPSRPRRGLRPVE